MTLSEALRVAAPAAKVEENQQSIAGRTRLLRILFTGGELAGPGQEVLPDETTRSE